MAGFRSGTGIELSRRISEMLASGPALKGPAKKRYGGPSVTTPNDRQWKSFHETETEVSQQDFDSSVVGHYWLEQKGRAELVAWDGRRYFLTGNAGEQRPYTPAEMHALGWRHLHRPDPIAGQAKD